MNLINAHERALEAIALAGLVAVSYASTNLDNFLVLSAYSAKSGYRPFLVKLTFVLVCLTVVLASLLLARAADTLIAEKLRYLGAVPIGIGLYQLGALVFRRRGPKDGGPDGETAHVSLTYVVGGASWTPSYEARADDSGAPQPGQALALLAQHGDGAPRLG